MSDDIINRRIRYLAMLHTFEGNIVNYCYSHSNGVADAQDLSQEIMALVWEKIDTLKADSTPRQQNRWIYKVMRTAFIRHLRHRLPFRTVPLEEEMVAAEESATSRLEELMEQLDDEERWLLETRLQGYSHAEIADMQGLSEAAVKQRYYRIIMKIRIKAK
ncbi:MAG: RNA polymerase sigma factor [bacterium]